MALSSWLTRCPIIAILRGVRPEEIEAVCSSLEEEGIVVAEVPLNSPNPIKSIEIAARIFGDRMLIGAGTVIDPTQVEDVVSAGGRLIVTPHADAAIVLAAKAAGLIATPGFFNPTEAFALLRAGADALKLFPAEVLGVRMLESMRGVLPATAGIIPVGGIDAKNITQWLEAGAVGVGTGSSIYKPGDDALAVRKKAASLVRAARSSAN